MEEQKMEIIDDINKLHALIERYKTFYALQNYNISIDFSFKTLNETYYKHHQNHDVGFNDIKRSFLFENCTFEGVFEIPDNNKHNFEFIDCHFNKGFNVKNTKFEGKLKFRFCHFYETNFDNAVFQDLADFYRCEFHNTVIFFKTDFIGTTVFSASKFYENVLFTYSLIEKLIIFRGTIFEKGLDLSLSIRQGDINCFDIQLKDFESEIINSLDEEYELTYDNCVSEEGLIPLKNKRETFRILKHTLVSQNNISESIYFKVLEKNALKKELDNKTYKQKVKNEKCTWWKERWFYVKNDLEKFNLWLNWISNQHGSSYGQALFFILVVSVISFYLSAISSNTFDFTWDLSWSTFKRGLSFFMQFLLLTHNFNYIDGDELKKAAVGYFIWDFCGRLIVGYGIYQFIQAFRKYR
ncbi:MAG: pentapeptide repeat-containing protein [Bacteroidia bacterium]